MINIKPIAGRILVQKIEENSEKKIGSIIVSSAEDTSQINKGIAIAVSNKKNSDGTVIPSEIFVGNTVYFGKYSGVSVGSDNLLILNEAEIIGIVD